MVAVGAVALAGTGARFLSEPGRAGVEPAGLALLLAYVVTLVLLLATDLDQRLLPDPLTLPWIAIAFVAALSGVDPLVGDRVPAAVVAAVGIPALLLALSLPFGRGAIGVGDLKLLVSAGLVLGAERAVLGVLAGAILAGLVIAGLLALRRIGPRTFVPYGPFLILGALWSMLLPG